ncbi:MAG: hypothetical protein ACLQIB_47040 [Isosphaeraceae bacterium]
MTRRPASTGRGGVIVFVVVGESSARGEPYYPWLSVGQILGWQLEQVFPGRKIRVDVRADGGFCLEQAILLLEAARDLAAGRPPRPGRPPSLTMAVPILDPAAIPAPPPPANAGARPETVPRSH